MLKLPTNAGEWGFVIVLTLLFAGLAFGVIYSQVQLHEMKQAQARADTEWVLHAFAERVRQHRQQHGKLPEKLTDCGLPRDALESRHAEFDDEVAVTNGRATLTGRLFKFGGAGCVLVVGPEASADELRWAE